MVSRRQRKIAMKAGTADLAFGIAPSRYADWIAYVFDRPDTGWYFDIDRVPFDLPMNPSEFVDLVGLTLTRCGTDLAGFSNAQVKHGLNYFFNGPCSDYVYAFGETDVPLEKKVAAIRAMKHLYKDCLEARCDTGLGHLDESSNNPLNFIAYMLWDVTPIFRQNRQHEVVTAAIVDVLDFALRSRNDACIEGALHGLGHERRQCSLIDPIIDKFIATTRDASDQGTNHRGHASALRPIREELRTYARCARLGRIQ